jgi:hypothetical protein
MQSKAGLKKELHVLTDSVEDDKTLSMQAGSIIPDAVISKTDILDELSEEQQKDLELSVRESENGDNYTMEEFEAIAERWRTAQ